MESNAQPPEHQNSPRPLAEPLLRFDLAGAAEALRAGPPWEEHGHNARTLVKYDDFRVVLIVLRRGAKIDQHQTAERLSMQTISGEVRLRTPHHQIDVPEGSMMTLDRDIPHQVEALTDAAMLLTIAWSAGPKRHPRYNPGGPIR